jgi:hypothetical protein
VARRADDAASPKLVGERRAYDIECGQFIAALRRKIELLRHPERLATADKTR